MKLLDSPLPGHTALLASALTLALLTAAPQDAAGQNYSYNTQYSGRTIQHKPAKWHAMREGLNNLDDTFSEGEEYMTTVFGHRMQAAHEYIDTIYMHKGQTVTLSIPDQQSGTISANTYQRWYNYRTDGLFRTGETGNRDRRDLLVPSSFSTDVTAYRLANGYVGAPLTNSNGNVYGTNLYEMTFYYPTANEFSSWRNGLGQSDNQYYVVAADLSPYRDFYEDYSVGTSSVFSRTFCEPTLGHRAVFYIFDVDNLPDNLRYKALSSTFRTSGSRPQLGGNGVEYLYEYEISLPVTRTTNNTSELVTLPLDARAFKIPGASNSSDGALTITIGTSGSIYNTAGIQLCTNNNGVITNRGTNTNSTNATISGDSRAIFFQYPNQSQYGTRTVNQPQDGSDPRATIVVTKTIGGYTYNIARYRLTFKSECAPLTYRQILDLRDGRADGTLWENYGFRVPDSLDANDELTLLTSLDFDYDEEVSQTLSQGNYAGKRSEEYYPFPMAWINSSYGFFDGSSDTQTEFGGSVGGDFGYYAVTSKYVSGSGVESRASGDKYSHGKRVLSGHLPHVCRCFRSSGCVGSPVLRR